MEQTQNCAIDQHKEDLENEWKIKLVDTIKEWEDKLETEKASLKWEIESYKQQISKLNNDIDMIKEEVKEDIQNHIEINEKLSEELTITKANLIKAKLESINISSNTAENIYFDVKGTQFSFSTTSNLTLHLSDSKDRQFARSIKHFRLPQMENLYIQNIEEDDLDANFLLSNSIPDKLKNLNFNISEYQQLELSKYIFSLKMAASRVMGYLYVYHMNMTGEELIELLSSSKNCSSVYLYYWKIDSSIEIILGDRLDGWKTKNLSFYNTGLNKYSGWESDISKFESITLKAFVVTPSWNVRNFGHSCFWDDFYCPIHKLIKLVF